MRLEQLSLLTGSEAGKSKVKVPAEPVSGDPRSSSNGCLPAVLTRQRGPRALRVSLRGTLIHSEGPTLGPTPCAEAPPSNAATLGSGSQRRVRRGTDVQPAAAAAPPMRSSELPDSAFRTARPSPVTASCGLGTRSCKKCPNSSWTKLHLLSLQCAL